MLNGLGGRTLYVALFAVDMRKGADGLSTLVRERLGSKPEDGSAYVFINRRRTHLKVLFWESGGYWVCGKRLERGCFAALRQKEAEDTSKLRLSPARLGMLLEGLEENASKRRIRY